MLIAIIDDGIRNNIFGNLSILHDLSVARDGTITKRAQSDVVLTEHSTTCAAIIAKYAPEAEFCSLRIFHQPQLHATCEQLVSALKWCLANKVPIVHLSIGTNLLSDYSKIQPIIGQMLHQNQTIVAACSNSKIYSMPASFGGVLGVVADKQMVNSEYRIDHSRQSQAMIFASSSHSLMLKSGGNVITQITNSYAAPTVTAHIHNILQNLEPFSLTSAELLKKLGGTSLFPYYYPDYIADAYIINPEHHPLLHKHLYFNCLGELTKLSDLYQTKLRGDIVYLAPRKPDIYIRDYSWLIENSNCYGNLLYGGSLPIQNDFMLIKKLICDESIFENAKMSIGINYAKSKVPIVYIYGSELASLYLACELRKLFFADGYQCLCVSNWQFSYLYNIEYKSVISQITISCKYYVADIIIFCLNEVPSSELRSDDTYLLVLTEPIIPKDLVQQKRRISTTSDVEGKFVLDHYKKIVNFFNRPSQLET